MFGPTYFGPTYFGPTYFGPAPAAASESMLEPVDRGRQPISVNQPSAGSNYPIVDPSDDIRYLLADAYLAYDRKAQPYQHPLRITYLYGLGDQPVSQPAGTPTPTHDYDVVIKDANDIVVFDSTLVAGTHFHTADWGDRLRIIEWTGAEAVCRIVYHIGWSEGMEQLTYDEHIVPDSAVLDERVIDALPRRILSISVDDTTFEGGEVTLENGYNTTVATEDFEAIDGGQAGATITISSQPNSGAGRYPCEDDTTYIATINNVAPDERGNFALDAGGCYKLERPFQITGSSGGIPLAQLTSANTLRLRNNCGACCECDDYVAVYESLRKLNNRYLNIRDDAEEIRDQLRLNRARWEEQRSCRTRESSRLTLVALPGQKVAVGAVFCNPSDECLHDVQLDVFFEIGDVELTEWVILKPMWPTWESVLVGPYADLSEASEASENLAECEVESEAAGCTVPGTTHKIDNHIPGDGDNLSCGLADTKNFTSESRRRKITPLSGSWPHYSMAFDRVEPGGVVAFTTVFSFQPEDVGATIEAVLFASQDTNDDAVYETLLSGPTRASTNLLPDIDDENCY